MLLLALLLHCSPSASIGVYPKEVTSEHVVERYHVMVTPDPLPCSSDQVLEAISTINRKGVKKH